GPVRRRLAEPRGTAAAQDDGLRRDAEEDHHHQPLARYFLYPVDQSLSRLRAWLQLLLCAPDPRLYGPLARARLRKQALRQDQCGAVAARRTVEPELPADDHSARRQYRSLSA